MPARLTPNIHPFINLIYKAALHIALDIEWRYLSKPRAMGRWITTSFSTSQCAFDYHPPALWSTHSDWTALLHFEDDVPMTGFTTRWRNDVYLNLCISLTLLQVSRYCEEIAMKCIMCMHTHIRYLWRMHVQLVRSKDKMPSVVVDCKYGVEMRGNMVGKITFCISVTIL